mgnify:CR=1 FL=1
MISGKFNNWKYHGVDRFRKVDPPPESSEFYDEDTEPICIDITMEDDSESESDTEEYVYSSDYTDEYVWFEDESTITANGNIEITLKRVVNKNVMGYNKRGEIEEVKPKPRTIKII